MARAPRRRADLSYITHAPTRKVTLKKRMMGLMKKLEEVTTLCDIKSCAIIYKDSRESEPTLFPNDPKKVLSVISDFMRLDTECQTRKMLNQEDLLLENISKANEVLKRLQEKNRERMLIQLIQEHLHDPTKTLEDLTRFDLVDLRRLNKCYMAEIDQRIRNFEREIAQGNNPMPPNSTSELEQTNMASASNVPMNQENNGKVGQGKEPQVQFDQWFVGMMRNLLQNEASSSKGNAPF